MSLPATLWAERSGRERWMIAALAALIGGVVYWYGLWLPLGGWRHLAAQRLDTARRVSVEAERVRAETAKLHQPGPLESDITVSAREAGVRLGKIEASGKA
ncbi:MAG: type II secretion system protein GspM, partial [Alphaproteobacteria bacterium]